MVFVMVEDSNYEKTMSLKIRNRVIFSEFLKRIFIYLPISITLFILLFCIHLVKIIGASNGVFMIPSDRLTRTLPHQLATRH